MSVHRDGGHIHELFRHSARVCVKRHRVGLIPPTAERFTSYQKAAKAAGTFNARDQLILTAARIYQAHWRKQINGGCAQALAVRHGTPTHKTFQKVVHICNSNKWLLGEFIAAQFALMRAPLLRHLPTLGAERRYRKFARMLAGQAIIASVAPNERAVIERATLTSCNNLATILLARKSAELVTNDLSFCDRYTLAYFAKLSVPLPTEISAEIAHELALLAATDGRWQLLASACNVAVSAVLLRLAPANHEYTQATDRIKQAVIVALAGLYKIEVPQVLLPKPVLPFK